MRSLGYHETLLLTGGLILSGIFLCVDLLLPLGVAGGVMYVPVVLLSLWLPGRRYALGFAVLGTVLTIVGYIGLPSEGLPSYVLVNRILAVIGIWLAAFVAIHFKKNQEALEESEARNKLILDAAAEGIIILDETGLIQSVNRAAERIFGYNSDNVENKPVDILFADSEQTNLSELHAMIERGSRRFGDRHQIEELLGKRKDGTTFPLRIALSKVNLEHGVIFSAFVRDITDRRRMERKLVGLTEDERQQIGYDLHEGVGQTLNGIKLLTESLATDLEEADSESAQAANRVAELLQEADRQIGELIYQLTPVNLAANELSTALDHLVGAVPERENVDFTVITSGTQPVRDNTVVTHLYRIAQEALTNAIEHGRASRVVVRLHQGPEEIRLQIEDNGTGLHADLDELKGMGIRVMEYRARIIGAALRVEPAPESGTLVECRLPRRHVLAEEADEGTSFSAAQAS